MMGQTLWSKGRGRGLLQLPGFPHTRKNLGKDGRGASFSSQLQQGSIFNTSQENLVRISWWEVAQLCRGDRYQFPICL